jgi:hypothetical protein
MTSGTVLAFLTGKISDVQCPDARPRRKKQDIDRDEVLV